MTNVLLVEDDAQVAGLIRYYLEQDGYSVVWASTGRHALDLAKGQFDVILLDILLPDANGISLLSTMRRQHSGPIIFLSCLDDSDTIVHALSRGGDDFIAKPFDNRVLSARIQANLRRYGQKGGSNGPNRKCKGFALDVERHAVVKAGVETKLSATEFRILTLLMENVGRCYTPKQLYEQVWGVPSVGDTRTVLVHIHNLRQKIEDSPEDVRYLKLIWGQGYTFDPEGKPQEV